MLKLVRVSPECPKCSNLKTYDIIPEIPNNPEDQLKPGEALLFEKFSLGNARYRCPACNCTWKKYRGRKSYSEIKVIHASSGGFPGPYFEVKIDLQNRLVERESNEVEYDEEEPARGMLSDEETEWLLSELYKCDFVNWAEQYNEPGVLDGTHWSLRIEYETHCEMKYGSNHFPPKWTKFCKAVAKVSGGEFY